MILADIIGTVLAALLGYGTAAAKRRAKARARARFAAKQRGKR